MNAPRTAREALVAELLGDLDTLLQRIEALPSTVTSAEQRLAATAAALNAAGEQYRVAVTAFNEQAKADLSSYLDLKSSQVAHAATQTLEQQRAALQEAARTGLQSVKFQPSRLDRFAAHLLTALIAATSTAAMVAWVLPHR
jgi:hypothetical protein